MKGGREYVKESNDTCHIQHLCVKVLVLKILDGHLFIDGLHGWVAGQIGPRSNHCIIIFFLFNLIICIVNCVVYLIPNQMIVLLCCLFNLIICP